LVAPLSGAKVLIFFREAMASSPALSPKEEVTKKYCINEMGGFIKSLKRDIRPYSFLKNVLIDLKF
jgi:hypothetical protein